MSQLNAAAWDKNAIAFIRERGLESEFSDWCGGWPVPSATRLAAAIAKAEATATEAETLRSLLTEVRDACLYGDDDGIGVTNEPTIDDDLFARICEAVKPTATEAQHAGQWRPIESAPRDGTPILAWTIHANAKYAKDPIAERWACATIIQWIDHNGGGWTWHGLAGEHTHWQPLPEAPPPAAPPSPAPPSSEREGSRAGDRS